MEIRLPRQAMLRAWLQSLYPERTFVLTPASNDASFRRYFRIQIGEETRIAMDAPPSHEDCATFVKVAELFRSSGINVPVIHAQNLPDGFLLLSDLGDTTYLAGMTADNAHSLYLNAFDALVRIQQISRPGILPDYDLERLDKELQLFPDWYIAKHLGVTLTTEQRLVMDEAFTAILTNNLAQPKVFVHRDFHSRNLMITTPNPGILDFQDALYGPITYDAVSLLKDAYVEWDEERVLDWLIRYWEKAKRAGLLVNSDFAVFYRDFEWMGLQRHLKVLGIFARLYHRDGKDAYLKDLPLVLRYTRKACARYGEFGKFLKLLDQLTGHAEIAGYTF
jgi:N-acetylmuramate 1-kinase